MQRFSSTWIEIAFITTDKLLIIDHSENCFYMKINTSIKCFIHTWWRQSLAIVQPNEAHFPALDWHSNQPLTWLYSIHNSFRMKKLQNLLSQDEMSSLNQFTFHFWNISKLLIWIKWKTKSSFLFLIEIHRKMQQSLESLT